MRPFTHLFWIAALSAGLAGSAAASPVERGGGPPPASADGPPAEQRVIPYGGELPRCDDPVSLAEISSGFAGREQEYWNSGLSIVNYLEIGETGYRTNGLSYIPRRYCRAKADFSDGRRREVVFSIGEATGPLGLFPGVTWCVEGLDRNHAFSPNCRAAGP